VKYDQLNNLRQTLRRPVLRTVVRNLSYGVVAAVFLTLTLLAAFAREEAFWNWLKALLLPTVIAALGIFGGAWFTRQRARETALQAYLDKMSELLIDKRIH
jgi:hypothetical protein